MKLPANRYNKAAKTWLIIFFIISFFLFGCGSKQAANNDWPEITSQSRPWTRWWWMGNAMDTSSIKFQLEAFADVGLGGVEITPIYGVKGYEEKFLDHLSPQWMDMLDYTISEATRLGLGVDMILGTGWPYGGPQVEPEFAASKLSIRKYSLEADRTFSDFIQLEDPKQKDLAILQKVIYFDKEGKKVDLTPLVFKNQLTFTPPTDTELYAIFCSKTRQKVKRSAPGGVGFTLDHFSDKAFEDYIEPYGEMAGVFKNRLRAIFNDSYEVYQADYTPEMLEEFKVRRKYDLMDYIPILDQKTDEELYSRILCDFRETLSDLLLEDFAMNWDKWSNENTFITRYQAHGSPGNLIDLYAAADIPDCEVFGSPQFDIPGYRRDTANVRKGDSNKMMLKFCSSAAHLKGDELVSSETFTWLREHFKTALSHCKPVAEDLFLSGVNHIFLHGSTYSAKDDPWPGWKFYAAVNFNPNNAIWRDSRYLFDYIARCQSILQVAKTDNEVLLYWPIHDLYASAEPQNLLHQFGIHSIDDWLLPTSFYELATELDSKGYGFDFISDEFLLKAKTAENKIMVADNVVYKTLIVPSMKSIPLETFQQLIDLKNDGANIIFMSEPETVPGFYQFEEREAKLQNMVKNNKQWFNPKPDIESVLNQSDIVGEKAAQVGLKIIRKSLNGNKIYFIANHSSELVDQDVSFQSSAKAVLIMNPMTGKMGSAKINTKSNSTEVKIYLQPGETIFLKMSDKNFAAEPWNYPESFDEAIPLIQSWKLEFIEGGTLIPDAVTMPELQSWTNFGTDYENFSGTGKYSTSFDIKELTADAYILQLGDVRESARVFVNGKFAGAVFANPYSLDITEQMKKGENLLEIEVTNLSANRLRALERSGYEWKRFYEINMVNIHYEKFDAKEWKIEPSGLISVVKIVPVKYDKN